jgi:hypothetical protein
VVRRLLNEVGPVRSPGRVCEMCNRKTQSEGPET